MEISSLHFDRQDQKFFIQVSNTLSKYLKKNWDNEDFLIVDIFEDVFRDVAVPGRQVLKLMILIN